MFNLAVLQKQLNLNYVILDCNLAENEISHIMNLASYMYYKPDNFVFPISSLHRQQHM